MIQALSDMGVDFSVARTDLLDWLSNPDFTPYPSLAAALLDLKVALRRPVFIDVIALNYEQSPGNPSPRRVEDVDGAVLKAAVVEGHNSRYGEQATDFATLIKPIVIEPAFPGGGECGNPSGPLSDIQIRTFGAVGGHWSTPTLTYSVDPSGANLSAADVNTTIGNAFTAWTTAPWTPSWPFFAFTQIPTGGHIHVWFDSALEGLKLGAAGYPQSPPAKAKCASTATNRIGLPPSCFPWRCTRSATCWDWGIPTTRPH
jgi:hypothetical protein